MNISLKKTANNLAIGLSNQKTSWRNIMTLHLAEFCAQKRSLFYEEQKKTSKIFNYSDNEEIVSIPGGTSQMRVSFKKRSRHVRG